MTYNDDFIGYCDLSNCNFLGAGGLKGTVSRDFLLQVYYMNHLPPSP